MFHTFQSSVALRSPGSGEGGEGIAKPARSTGSRRISTSNACVECRRRKIRCDGTQPCGQCQWYQHPEACSYSKPAQRVVPSRKLVDKLQGQIDQYKLVLSRLFPGKEVESLVSLPREELLSLALSLPTTATSPSNSIPQTLRHESTPRSDGADSLEALEQAPEENPEWDEAKRHQDKIQGISDDVNGLSMSVERPTSYMGITSITAALKVIMKTCPAARPYIIHGITETALPSRSNTPPPQIVSAESPTTMPPMDEGQELVESYFEKVHPFFPMIDERKFWTTYLYGERKDASWLALLNMVFALGSLASSTIDNETHITYFARARQNVSLETFGSGSIEALQAMAMMSGYYMHYLNRPNEASSLMGATLRMATALGLHREYTEPSSPGNGKTLATATTNGVSRTPANSAMSAEMKRRVWWSIFVLDTWASTTTGRPSLGRMGSGITVQSPGKVQERVGSAFEQPSSAFNPPSSTTYDASQPTATQLAQNSSLEQYKILPLIYNTEFCKIATLIQDRLATTPLMKFDELVRLDNDLVRWREELPLILTSDDPCPEILRVPRSVMKWRYQNLRVVLHRPFLLATALRRVPFADLGAEEKVAVGKCRIIAGKTIEDISKECTPDLISGWNAVWFMFQACMVPLVGLFSDLSNPDEAEKWRSQIETALEFFSRMIAYNVTAKKSMDAVAKLYGASKMVTAMSPPEPSQILQAQCQPEFPGLAAGAEGFEGGPGAVPMAMHPAGVSMGGGWADPAGMGNLSGFWDDMMWDTFPDINENPFGLGEFEFPSTAQDLGNVPCWALGN